MTTVCRRCERPLSAPLAVAAGIGSCCALREAVEAAQGAPWPVAGQQVEQAAIALMTARLTEVEPPVVEAVLADVPPDEVALYLAHVCAFMIRETTGGERWLRRLGLSVAEASV